MKKNRFLELREEKGLNQTELSKAINVTRAVIINLELSDEVNGQKQYKPETLKEYSKYFNVSIDYLLNNSDTRSKDEDIRMISNTTGLNDKAITFLKAIKNSGSRLLNVLNFLLSHFNNIVDFEEALCEYFYSHDDAPLIPVITKIDGKKIEHLSSDTTSKIFKEDVKKKKPLDERRYMLELSDKPNGNTKESFMLDKTTISTMRTIRLMESLSKLRDRFQNEGK